MPSIVGFVAGLGRIRLTLELTPNPTRSGGDILAVALSTEERTNNPLSDKGITLWLGKDEVGTFSTDENGRIAEELTGLGFGTHAVAAQIGGLALTARHTFKKEAAKVGRLARPNFRAEGDEGDYIIAGSLTYEDGKPASGIRVRFLISPLGAKPRDEHDVSDADGFVRYRLSFEEAECDVTVQVREFEQKIENLYGRSRTPKPSRYQRPDNAELRQGSFMDVIRRAWQRGGKDAKGETR